jgi:hypothetical protein
MLTKSAVVVILNYDWSNIMVVVKSLQNLVFRGVFDTKKVLTHSFCQEEGNWRSKRRKAASILNGSSVIRLGVPKVFGKVSGFRPCRITLFNIVVSLTFTATLYSALPAMAIIIVNSIEY